MPQPAVFIAPITTPISVVAMHGNGRGTLRCAIEAECRPRNSSSVTSGLPGGGVAGGAQPLPPMRADVVWPAHVVAATRT